MSRVAHCGVLNDHMKDKEHNVIGTTLSERALAEKRALYFKRQLACQKSDFRTADKTGLNQDARQDLSY